MEINGKLYEMRNLIDILIKEELEKGTKKYGEFSSRHEAIAVINEEVEEFHNELFDIEKGLEDYWNNIKKNTYDKELLLHLEAASYCAIEELIQVAAMISKAKRLERRDI
jgi:hypothetical protein